MKKSKLPEEKELQLKCDCGCAGQILFTLMARGLFLRGRDREDKGVFKKLV